MNHYPHCIEPLQQHPGRHISVVHPPPLSTREARAPARNVLASDYTASHLAISMINGEMDLLHSAGEAYAAQLTAWGVKVELSEGAQHGSLNLPLTPQGAQSLKLIVGSPTRALHRPQSPRYDSHSYIAHYRTRHMKPPENREVSSQDRFKLPLDTQGLSEQAALPCSPFHLRSTAYLVLVL